MGTSRSRSRSFAHAAPEPDAGKAVRGTRSPSGVYEPGGSEPRHFPVGFGAVLDPVSDRDRHPLPGGHVGFGPVLQRFQRRTRPFACGRAAPVEQPGCPHAGVEPDGERSERPPEGARDDLGAFRLDRTAGSVDRLGLFPRGAFTRAQRTSFFGCRHEQLRRAVHKLVAQGVASEEKPPGINSAPPTSRVQGDDDPWLRRARAWRKTLGPGWPTIPPHRPRSPDSHRNSHWRRSPLTWTPRAVARGPPPAWPPPSGSWS